MGMIESAVPCSSSIGRLMRAMASVGECESGIRIAASVRQSRVGLSPPMGPAAGRWGFGPAWGAGGDGAPACKGRFEDAALDLGPVGHDVQADRPAQRLAV